MNEKLLSVGVTSTQVTSDSAAAKANALQQAIALLLPLSATDCKGVLETLAIFFGVQLNSGDYANKVAQNIVSKKASHFQFSEGEEPPSPKAFLFEKAPKTDVERVACLAYYLAKFRQVAHVKTKDITALNTESAHRPFSNTAVSVDNATKTGYLVPSVKGSKQISALGERFVEALPDREGAREVFENFKRRRNKRGMSNADS